MPLRYCNELTTYSVFVGIASFTTILLLSAAAIPEFTAVIVYSIIEPGIRFGLLLLIPSLMTSDVFCKLILGTAAIAAVSLLLLFHEMLSKFVPATVAVLVTDGKAGAETATVKIMGAVLKLLARFELRVQETNCPDALQFQPPPDTEIKVNPAGSVSVTTQRLHCNRVWYESSRMLWKKTLPNKDELRG